MQGTNISAFYQDDIEERVVEERKEGADGLPLRIQSSWDEAADIEASRPIVQLMQIHQQMSGQKAAGNQGRYSNVSQNQIGNNSYMFSDDQVSISDEHGCVKFGNGERNSFS